MTTVPTNIVVGKWTRMILRLVSNTNLAPKIVAITTECERQIYTQVSLSVLCDYCRIR